jgi:hypothetical protein
MNVLDIYSGPDRSPEAYKLYEEVNNNILKLAGMMQKRAENKAIKKFLDDAFTAIAHIQELQAIDLGEEMVEAD